MGIFLEATEEVMVDFTQEMEVMEGIGQETMEEMAGTFQATRVEEEMVDFTLGMGAMEGIGQEIMEEMADTFQEIWVEMAGIIPETTETVDEGQITGQVC